MQYLSAVIPVAIEGLTPSRHSRENGNLVQIQIPGSSPRMTRVVGSPGLGPRMTPFRV